MKQPKAESEPKSESLPPQDSKGTKKTTDKEGLDRAYASDNNFYRDPSGTLHVAGTRGGFLGSDWMENYRVYGPGLIRTLGDMYGKLDSGKFGWKDWYSTRQPFNIEDTELYKSLDKYMEENKGEVDNFVAHSKGSSVVEKWMENHLEFTGHARLYAKPHIDVIGSEKFKDYLNQTKQIRHEFYTQNFWVRAG